MLKKKLQVATIQGCSNKGLPRDFKQRRNQLKKKKKKVTEAEKCLVVSGERKGNRAAVKTGFGAVTVSLGHHGLWS